MVKRIFQMPLGTFLTAVGALDQHSEPQHLLREFYLPVKETSNGWGAN